LGIFEQATDAIPLEFGSIFTSIATERGSGQSEPGQVQRQDNKDLPRPIQLAIGANVAMAGIVDDEQVIGSGVL
jgi:hypothetical protein